MDTCLASLAHASVYDLLTMVTRRVSEEQYRATPMLGRVESGKVPLEPDKFSKNNEFRQIEHHELAPCRGKD